MLSRCIFKRWDCQVTAAVPMPDTAALSLHWQCEGRHEVRACRGGTPVCWPQFNDMGPLSSHGFARNSQFAVKEISDSQVVMRLTSEDVAVDGFPSGWSLSMTVAVSDDDGGTLKQTVCSTGGACTLQQEVVTCTRLPMQAVQLQPAGGYIAKHQIIAYCQPQIPKVLRAPAST